jgi:radical SAM protein with 4Fe4S-binding SPASM domain
LSALRVKHIEFTGGEPLLNTNLRGYIKHALSHSMKITVATNGMLLNDDIIDFFVSNNVHVQISLHGSLQKVSQKRRSKDIGTAAVVAKIRKIAELNPKLLSVTHTVGKDSINSIKNFIAYAKSINVKVILGRPFRVGRAVKNWDSIKVSCCEIPIQCFVEDTEYKNISFRCSPCNMDSLNILYNGDVSTCVLLRTGTSILGNIYKSTLSDIWNSPKRKHLSSVRVDDIPICIYCEYKYICGGGCTAGSYSMVGKIGEPFPYCTFQRDRIKSYYEEKHNVEICCAPPSKQQVRSTY